MNKGDKYFIVDQLMLTERAIVEKNPFIVSERIFEDSYMDRCYADSGMTYETYGEAKKSAMKMYYDRKMRQLSRPWKENTDNFYIYFDGGEKHLCIANETEYPNSSFYFNTRNEAEKALTEISEENYMKYIIGLTNTKAYVSIEL